MFVTYPEETQNLLKTCHIHFSTDTLGFDLFVAFISDN